MIEKVKQTTSEKLLLALFIILGILDTITDDHRREYVLRPDFINSFKLLID